MHLLIRKLSPYDADDLLLGGFRTSEHAGEARREYLDTVVHGPSDPWAHQSYHSVSDDDVTILSSVLHLGVDEGAERVFVVSAYSEGFGQVIRTFEAIAGSEKAARDHAAALEAKDDGEFPYHCEVHEMRIGELHSGTAAGGTGLST